MNSQNQGQGYSHRVALANCATVSSQLYFGASQLSPSPPRKTPTMKLSPAILTLLGLYLGTLTEAANFYPGQKILLSKVGSLTLRNDQVTKSRRVDPIPQVPIRTPVCREDS